jgi:chromosome segregation ATPase
VDDLSAAATRALDTVADLRAGIEDAESRLAQAQEHLARGSQELETEWSRVSGQLGELVSLITGWSQDLAAEAAAAADSRAELASAGERLEAEARAEREARERDLGSLTERLHAVEVQVEHAVEEAEQAEAALRDKLATVDDELEQSLATVRTILEQDLTGEVASFEEELEQRTREVQQTLLDEFASGIDARIEELLQRLHAAQERLEEALETAGNSVAEAAENAVDKWKDCQEELAATLSGVTDGVEALLGQLKQFAEDGNEHVAGRRQSLAQAAEETEASVEAALALIRSTEQALRRYDFVRF